MAKIVVFGAAGKAGSRIVKEAAARGHEVLAVTRDGRSPEGISPKAKVVTGDPTSPASVRALTAGTDAFVVAVGGPDSTLWLRAAKTVVETLQSISGPLPRVVHMGGGSSLLTPDGIRFADLPEFPEAWRLPAKGQVDALDFYQTIKDPRIVWTYLSPPPMDFYPGERTGHYRTGLDHPVADAKGKSTISYEDFSVALVDEIENGKFKNTRFTVGY